MTTKEKAQELFNKTILYFYEPEYDHSEDVGLKKPTKEGDFEAHCCKKVCIIYIDEILKSIPIENKLSLTDYSYIKFKYWQEVKQEIEKL
jgi:hypothetical protein